MKDNYHSLKKRADYQNRRHAASSGKNFPDDASYDKSFEIFERFGKDKPLKVFTTILAKADDLRKKGEIEESFKLLNKSYDFVEKYLSAEDSDKEKYLDSISRRAKRTVKAMQDRNEGHRGPDGFDSYSDYIFEKVLFIEKLDKEKEKLRGRSHHNLEGVASATTTVIGLIGGIFFLSPNLTGNVVANLTQTSSNIIGGTLFLIGVVGAFFYFRRR